MISFFSATHQLHAPEFEFFRGQRVPCFESPIRAQYVLDALTQGGHDVRVATLDSSDLIRQVHSERYLDFLESAWDQWLALDSSHAQAQPFPSVWPVRTLRDDVEPTNFIAKLGLYSMDNGTPLVAGTWAAVKAGADMAASAAALITYGERAVFCASRPPGHHAGADFMGGYCFLNNAAIAAQGLIERGLKRIAILDVDYHHGNGTQSIFYDRADVLFASIHSDPRAEYPFYLGHADEVGTGAGRGFNLNLPLPHGTKTSAWFAALESAANGVSHYAPEALVVSLGLDTFGEDPLSKFSLQSPDFYRLGERIAQIGLPTVFILEGGYAAKELGTNAVNVLDGFERACIAQAN